MLGVISHTFFLSFFFPPSWRLLSSWLLQDRCILALIQTELECDESQVPDAGSKHTKQHNL